MTDVSAVDNSNSETLSGHRAFGSQACGDRQRTNVGGSFARTGTPQAVPPASYNANNQLTNWKGAALTYDLDGNLTNDGVNTYTWNARNQLVSISGSVNATFQYDAFGRRVSKTFGATTQFLYDGANPVQEISGASASANLLDSGLDEFFQRTDSSGSRSFLSDALGSTLALADSTGTVQTSYTFEPFGTTTVSGAPSANSFAFTARELDPSGLYFLRARYYSPSLQRFLAEDPLGLAGGGPNLYAYAGDDPVDFIDPLGLYNVWNFWYDAGTFSEAFADTLTFGSASRLNDGLAQAAGRSTPTNRCGWAHGTGTAAGVAFGFVVGAGLGAEAGEAGALDPALTRPNAAFPRGIERVETSHWLSWFKNTALDGEWNWKEMWGTDHALNDPSRFRFMRAWWKLDPESAMPNALTQMWNRMPAWAQGAAIGGAYAGTGAATATIGRGCGCH